MGTIYLLYYVGIFLPYNTVLYYRYVIFKFVAKNTTFEM